MKMTPKQRIDNQTVIDYVSTRKPLDWQNAYGRMLSENAMLRRKLVLRNREVAALMKKIRKLEQNKRQSKPRR